MFDGNRVTAHTRSRYPIFQSPMTWIARAPLVSAVSAAGAMGLLENSIRDLTVTKREFTTIRANTNQPFGVSLPIRYLQMDPAEEKAIIDWLLGQGIHFVTTSAGDPTRYTKMLKAAGVTVYHATATLRGAQKAVDAGVDGLIVEGAESAGIRNPEEVHTFALLQAVREAVDVPIVAAGGIVDGRGMAAAFALGAEGVTMGTRFVASFESPVHLNYKQAIVAAPITGTSLVDNPPRARSRGLRTPYAVEVAEGKRERLARNATLDMLYVNGDVDNTHGAAGESAGIRNPEEVHTFALLQAVREVVDVPIVAAGGIVDGRGMAAAFALGAEGVTMGTRFVASFESPVHVNYKNAIVAAPLTGTIMTDNPPRARSRGLRTPYSVEVSEGKRERLPRGGLIDMLYVQGDVDNTSGAAGESAGLIHELKSVHQIVDETIAGFWREIDRLARLRPI